MTHWIKGKQSNPYQRPRIDWMATWKPFVPFWIIVALIGVAAGLIYNWEAIR